MSIYHRTYTTKLKDGTKVTRTAEYFTIEVRSPSGELVRQKGPRDRKAAKAAEVDLIRKLERGHFKVGDPYKEFRNTKISETIQAFIDNLRTEGNADMYLYTSQKRLERLAVEMGWRTIFDATRRDFEAWRNQTAKKGRRGKPTKAKTLNQFLATANQFFDWCAETERMEFNPLRTVKKIKEIDNVDYRRPATPDELQTFLKALPSDELRRFYIFLAYTALRRASLEGLTWGDLKINGDEPAVIVRAVTNKVRRQQSFPLRKDVAAMMAAAKEKAKPAGKVFKVPTIDEHKAYLAKAGIAFDDGKGQHRLDIHAFRKTLHTWMEDAGVDVREASKALGHLHLTTTLKSYRAKRDGKAEAGVEKLPTLIGKGVRS